jgi:hypothetical protein
MYTNLKLFDCLVPRIQVTTLHASEVISYVLEKSMARTTRRTGFFRMYYMRKASDSEGQRQQIAGETPFFVPASLRVVAPPARIN